MASKQWIAVGCIVGGLALGAVGTGQVRPRERRGSRSAPRRRTSRSTTWRGEIRIWLREHYKGTVTLVNIWATWCVPCKVEMPALQRAYDSLGAERLQDRRGQHRRRRPRGGPASSPTRLHLTFDILQDQSGRIQEAYQTTGVPESFLLDRSGTIVRRVIGAHEWDSPLNLALIRRLLQDSAQ